MARYHFHLHTAAGLTVEDEIGDDLLDDAAAEHHAIASAKDLMKASRRDWRQVAFEVYDHHDHHVVTVWFREVAASLPTLRHRSPPDDHHA
jgi:hypothetical protein